MRLWKWIVLGLAMAGPLAASDRDMTLFASAELVESGLMKFMVPRFSLKTGVGVHVEALAGENEVPPDADVVLSLMPAGEAAPALRKGETVYFVALAGPSAGPKAGRFVDWLLGEIGQRAVDQFARDGAPVFASVGAAEAVVEEVAFDGDIMAGETVSYLKCGRCHVIGERNRMAGIGSTPSFGVVRAIPNWRDRFMTFFARAPHPAVTQVEGMTQPFDIARPPPIKPVVLTQKEYEDMLAYVATIEPADLGAPLQTQ